MRTKFVKIMWKIHLVSFSRTHYMHAGCKGQNTGPFLAAQHIKCGVCY